MHLGTPELWPVYKIYPISPADLFLQLEEKKLATLLWSITALLTRPRTDKYMFRFKEMKVHSALKLIGTPTRV